MLSLPLRMVPDFPKPGIQFKDISPILSDPKAFRACIDAMASVCQGYSFDQLGLLDARGFLFGSALAYHLNKPFFMIRKKGKLPYKTFVSSYELEYGSSEMEVHQDAMDAGRRVILVDDILATGGTLKAAADLVERCQGEVLACVTLLEVEGLEGRSVLEDYPLHILA